jgi:hypothetical protein
MPGTCKDELAVCITIALKYKGTNCTYPFKTYGSVSYGTQTIESCGVQSSARNCQEAAYFRQRMYKAGAGKQENGARKCHWTGVEPGAYQCQGISALSTPSTTSALSLLPPPLFPGRLQLHTDT